jgi:hypothetical protein
VLSILDSQRYGPAARERYAGAAHVPDGPCVESCASDVNRSCAVCDGRVPADDLADAISAIAEISRRLGFSFCTTACLHAETVLGDIASQASGR